MSTAGWTAITLALIETIKILAGRKFGKRMHDLPQVLKMSETQGAITEKLKDVTEQLRMTAELQAQALQLMERLGQGTGSGGKVRTPSGAYRILPPRGDDR